jgi:hypothetical protein
LDTLESASRLLFPSANNILTPDTDWVIKKLPTYIDKYRTEGESTAAGLEAILQDLLCLKRVLDEQDKLEAED